MRKALAEAYVDNGIVIGSLPYKIFSSYTDIDGGTLTMSSKVRLS